MKLTQNDGLCTGQKSSKTLIPSPPDRGGNINSRVLFSAADPDQHGWQWSSIG
jgi:hypothetical protein